MNRKYLLVAVGVMSVMALMSSCGPSDSNKGQGHAPETASAPVAQVQQEPAPINHEVLDQASYCAGVAKASADLFKGTDYHPKLIELYHNFVDVANNHAKVNEDKFVQGLTIQMTNGVNKDDKAFALEVQQCIDWGTTLD